MPIDYQHTYTRRNCIEEIVWAKTIQEDTVFLRLIEIWSWSWETLALELVCGYTSDHFLLLSLVLLDGITFIRESKGKSKGCHCGH